MLSISHIKRDLKKALVVKNRAHNISKILHNEPLDNKRVKYIKHLVFSNFDVAGGKQKSAWSTAVNSMNEYLRRPKLNNSEC